MKRSPLRRKTPLRNGKPRSGPPRAGKNLRCVVCAVEFYAAPNEILRGAKYCSQACMGIDQSNRSERRKLTAHCSICGGLLPDPGPPSRRRKVCGHGCLLEYRRRIRLGDKNPSYKGDQAGSVRWRSQAERSCRVCGSTERLHLHHVVYDQKVRREGGDRYEPTNSMTICSGCHCRHHAAPHWTIPLSFLRDENYVFAARLLGAGAYDYLRRYYAGDDLRLDALLASPPTQAFD